MVGCLATWCAIASARLVFPVPIPPQRRTPLPGLYSKCGLTYSVKDDDLNTVSRWKSKQSAELFTFLHNIPTVRFHKTCLSRLKKGLLKKMFNTEFLYLVNC